MSFFRREEVSALQTTLSRADNVELLPQTTLGIAGLVILTQDRDLDRWNCLFYEGCPAGV